MKKMLMASLAMAIASQPTFARDPLGIWMQIDAAALARWQARNLPSVQLPTQRNPGAPRRAPRPVARDGGAPLQTPANVSRRLSFDDEDVDGSPKAPANVSRRLSFDDEEGFPSAKPITVAEALMILARQHLPTFVHVVDRVAAILSAGVSFIQGKILSESRVTEIETQEAGSTPPSTPPSTPRGPRVTTPPTTPDRPTNVSTPQAPRKPARENQTNHRGSYPR